MKSKLTAAMAACALLLAGRAAFATRPRSRGPAPSYQTVRFQATVTYGNQAKTITVSVRKNGFEVDHPVRKSAEFTPNKRVELNLDGASIVVTRGGSVHRVEVPALGFHFEVDTGATRRVRVGRTLSTIYNDADRRPALTVARNSKLFLSPHLRKLEGVLPEDFGELYGGADGDLLLFDETGRVKKISPLAKLRIHDKLSLERNLAREPHMREVSAVRLLAPGDGIEFEETTGGHFQRQTRVEVFWVRGH